MNGSSTLIIKAWGILSFAVAGQGPNIFLVPITELEYAHKIRHWLLQTIAYGYPLLKIFKEALPANMVDCFGLSRRVGRIELGADVGILGTIHMLFATVTELSVGCHSSSNPNLCIGVIIQVHTILMTSISHWLKGRQSSQQAHAMVELLYRGLGPCYRAAEVLRTGAMMQRIGS
jgi:hypothetical protein